MKDSAKPFFLPFLGKSFLYSQSVVQAACSREGQSEHELKIRRFLIDNHLERLREDGEKHKNIGITGAAISFSLSLIALASAFGCLAVFPLFGVVLFGAMAASGHGVVYGCSEAERVLPEPPRPETIRYWLSECLKSIRQHSLARLSLSEASIQGFDSFHVGSPIVWKVPGVQDHDLLWRFEGNDEFYGVYELVFAHFAPEHLAVFMCDYNFLKNISLNERTYEVSYQDIVLLKTEEESSALTLPTGQKLTSSQDFSITTASGTAIKLGSSRSSLRQLLADGDSPPSGAKVDQAVTALRIALRDRKLALTHSFNDV